MTSLNSHKFTIVGSSNLVSIQHQPDTSALEVEFKNGSIYRYDAVSTELFEQFKVADTTEPYRSYGKFFNAKIVKDGFRSTQIKPPHPKPQEKSIEERKYPDQTNSTVGHATDQRSDRRDVGAVS